MIRNRFSVAGFFVSLAFLACTEPEKAVDAVPSQAEIEDARTRVGLSTEAVGQGRAVLELLGVIPVYTCGEPRAVFAGKLPGELQTRYTGASLSLDATDPKEDVISVAFPAAGSTVHGQKVTGAMTIRTSGGTDRFSLEIDARDAQVNGKAVQALAGYGTCGDSTAYWAEAEGLLPGTTADYALEAEVGKRAGIPVIGSTTLLIDADAAVTRAGATDRVTLSAVDYQVGKLLPRSGTVTIVTASGRRISATFTDNTPIAGQVRIKVDDKAAVTVLLPKF